MSTVGGHYMESHATKSHTRLNGRMVCVCGWRAGVRMPLARVRGTDAIAWARAWRQVSGSEWK